MPVGRIGLAAVDVLCLVVTFDCCGRFVLVANDKRGGNPFFDGKVKGRIIRGRGRRYDRGNSGCCRFGHGGGARESFVQGVLKDGRRTERWQKTRTEKSVISTLLSSFRSDFAHCKIVAHTCSDHSVHRIQYMTMTTRTRGRRTTG